MFNDWVVNEISTRDAVDYVVLHHYLHRRPPVSYSFGLFVNGVVKGVITYGVPASRHLQKSACMTNPDKVIELNRLFASDELPRNTESWFISQTLKKLPPLIVVSYADTKQNHVGYVYRAAGWNYNGYTDMDRKTPRFDYTVPNKHSRAAFRKNNTAEVIKVRRVPKYRYWTTTGNRRDRRQLSRMCTWACLDWKKVFVGS